MTAPARLRRRWLALLAALAVLAGSPPYPAAGQTLSGDGGQTLPAAPTQVTRGADAEAFDTSRPTWREQNFPAYLATMTASAGLLLGTLFALLARRFGDPMSPYRLVRRNTSLLAFASGAGLGVLIAVLQVPSDLPGRVTLLLLSVVCAATSAGLASFTGLLFVRRLGKRRT